MVTRKRVRSHIQQIVAGGGPSSVAAAQINWGPDYGTTNQQVEAHLAMSTVTGNYPMTEEVALRPTTFTARYPMTEELHIGSTMIGRYPMTEELSISSMNLRSAYTMQSEELSLRPTSFRANYPMTEEAMLRPSTFTARYAVVEELHFSQAEYRVVEIRCVKDGWASTDLGLLGTCVDTANHNNEVISIAREQDLLSTLGRSGLIGFDLSGFPANASITSVQLVLNTLALDTTLRVDFRGISSANENWAEGTLVCSNMPADAGPQAQRVLDTVAGDTVIDITTASFSTYIQNRIGTTVTMSLKFRPSTITTGTTATFASRDTGTTANAPRLRLTYTVPT